MSINKVILVGNVGKDPVVRYFDKGLVKAAFPLATSESYKNAEGETITVTEWHNIVFWRALAEVAEKTVKKGTQVYVVGKIKTRSYVDKEGNNKYITEILGDTLMVLDKKQTQNTWSGSSGNIKSETPDRQETDSGINEPGTGYGSNSKESAGDNDKNNITGDEPSVPGDPSGESGYDQSEDDLPF